eukprot:541670_1
MAIDRHLSFQIDLQQNYPNFAICVRDLCSFLNVVHFAASTATASSNHIMSNTTDKKTMQQNAMDIKSQRKQRIEENKEQEKIEEDNKVMLHIKLTNIYSKCQIKF